MGCCPASETQVVFLQLSQVCFARNTHSRTLEDVTAAQQQWDPVPPSFPQLDATSLLRPISKPQV